MRVSVCDIEIFAQLAERKTCEFRNVMKFGVRHRDGIEPVVMHSIWKFIVGEIHVDKGSVEGNVACNHNRACSALGELHESVPHENGIVPSGDGVAVDTKRCRISRLDLFRTYLCRPFINNSELGFFSLNPFLADAYNRDFNYLVYLRI